VYDTEWLRTHGAFPISATIPLSATPVPARVFLPWAANLLPEGRALRRIGELFQAAPEDVISILSEIGRDTAGALSIGAAGSTNFKDYREIASEDDLEKIINELPAKPFLAGEDGVSMSLAGVQTKLGVRLLEIGRLAVPINGSPSTHS
jgi:serine/threonine-protein kinase HipA